MDRTDEGPGSRAEEIADPNAIASIRTTRTPIMAATRRFSDRPSASPIRVYPTRTWKMPMRTTAAPMMKMKCVRITRSPMCHVSANSTGNTRCSEPQIFVAPSFRTIDMPIVAIRTMT